MYTYVDVDVYVYVWPRVSYVRSYPGASRSRLLLPNNTKIQATPKIKTQVTKKKTQVTLLPAEACASTS